MGHKEQRKGKKPQSATHCRHLKFPREHYFAPVPQRKEWVFWMVSNCGNNKHFVKAALCSATKAGIVHWIPELVRVFDVATLGLAPPQGICAFLWQSPSQGKTVT